MLKRKILERTAIGLMTLALAPFAPAQTRPAASSGSEADAAAATMRTPAGAPRPRVGLVLGGGGARGAAHIGVLEVLERMRVPVDCVVGTSMGALVTGAFAAGLSPAEMREALAKADWADMFKDDPDFYDMSYRNKRLAQSYPPGTEFGVSEKGLTYAPGVVSGQKIKAFFNQLVRADRGELLIDELPLPVSLIATDIVSGGRVVMRQGSLTQAMRASMSVPGLMAPVQREGQKLVDGGLVDNVPITEARERCKADVVIAINVGSPLLSGEKIGSLLSVSAQMVNILTEQNVTRSIALLKPTDIYIKPDLSGITAGDFDRSSETADRGVTATEAAASQLAPLAVSDAEYASWRRRTVAPVPPPAQVDQIEITGLTRVNPANVQRAVGQEIGKPLDTAALDADLLRVYGEGYYERVDYTLLRLRDRNLLRITPVEKAWGPDYLRFGLGLETDRAGSGYSLRAAYHKTWADALGAEVLTVVQIGQTLKVALDYFQPLDAAKEYFIEPKIGYQRQAVDIYEDGQKVSQQTVREAFAEVAAGRRLGNLGQGKLGWRQVRKSADTSIGAAVLPPVDVDYGGAFVTVDLDRLDRVFNPRNGWAVASNYFVAKSEDYSSLQVYLRGAQQFGEDWVVQGRIGYHGSPSGQLPVYDAAKLGGFLNLSAFSAGQLVGDNASYAGLRLERVLSNLPLGIRGDMRLGLMYESGRMGRLYTETKRTGWQDSIGLYLGGDTPIGPVYLGVAHSTTAGYTNVYLTIGVN